MTWMIKRTYYPTASVEFWIRKRRVSAIRFIVTALMASNIDMIREWVGLFRPTRLRVLA